MNGFLDLARPLHCIQRAGKLREHAVASRFDDASPMPFGARTDDIREQRHPALVGPRLVFRHEDRIAGDIGECDRGESPGTAAISGRSSRYGRRGGHLRSGQHPMAPPPCGPEGIEHGPPPRRDPVNRLRIGCDGPAFGGVVGRALLDRPYKAPRDIIRKVSLRHDSHATPKATHVGPPRSAEISV